MADALRRMGEQGVTLIELLVVIVVMTVAVGVVAPAFLPRESDDAQSELSQVLRKARAVAAQRGETVFLRMGTAGSWQMEGAASLADGPIAAGKIAGHTGVAATIVVSPVGTCAFDVRSSHAWNVLALDPLVCEIEEP